MKNNNRSISGNISSDTIIEINGKILNGNNIYFNEDYVSVDGVKRDDLEMKDFMIEVYDQTDVKEDEDKENDENFGITLIISMGVMFVFMIMVMFAFIIDDRPARANAMIFETDIGSCEVIPELGSDKVTYNCQGNEIEDLSFSLIVDATKTDIDYNIDSSCELTEDVGGHIYTIHCDDFSIVKIK
jgi:hypothetical protein